MNIFYNNNGVGDVLMVQLTTERPVDMLIDKKGDVTIIKDEASGKVVAFNLFNASKYVSVKADGQVETTEEIVNEMKIALEKNSVTMGLDVDFSPKFVIGYVRKKEKHPNADKLSVCTVDVGKDTLQIVCGAPNVDADQKVVIAKVGAVMPSGMIIRDAELRGVASSGMICSAKELNLPNAPEEKGILVLPSDSVIGEEFKM
ncbi:DUF4479 domain-containing protein [Sporosarcina sp. Sa2YVA2]|uniref:DUF4479 domain-containing protein n=1 Tax=Sporosarcina quadrami TaxID=2762234 RepID=A0ABR8U8H4_9BACL|nr:DUF4479 family protein [Sporosarcina quadrami]MBD7984341.1 DUF4479 domain-containing protein [Sporosarcina quadrami]